MSHKTYRDHLQDLTCDTVQSANCALDFFDGVQLCHLEDELSAKHGGITKWRERGVKPRFENVTKKVIERSALTYNDEPKRAVFVGDTEDEAATELYSDLLHEADFSALAQHFDQSARLLKVAIALPQYDSELQKLNIALLHRGNCDVDYDADKKEIRSLFYSLGCPGPSGGRMYRHCTAAEYVDIEITGQTTKVIHREDNPLGMIPMAVLYDNTPPRCGFWPRPAWEELVGLNKAINLFHTETDYARRWQSFGTPVTDAKIPDGAVFGPDAPVQLDPPLGGAAPFFSFESPSINLKEFQEWLEKYESNIAENWGVNLEASGAADSGFKLEVKEVWNLETRKQRQKAAKVFERQLYQAIRAVVEPHGIILPEDGQVWAEFKDAALPVNDAEKWMIAKEQIALGVISKRRYLKRMDPDLTDEEIDEILAEVKAEQVRTTTAPRFEGVIGS